MRLLFLALASAATSACAPAGATSTFSGIARAMDGDSLMVGEREVRLFGIDAPEFGQTCTKNGQPWACGEAAADQLSKLVTGQSVLCIAVDTDDYGRTVARCTAGAVDVNRAMVASGFATAYRRYSTAYVSAEQSAKVNRRGLWSGEFEMPAEVRHADEARPSKPSRSSSKPVVSSIRSRSQPSGDCRIKGNRGSNGWIYHVPGMPYYERTNAEEIFCTEAEARAAGYRRAKVR